MKLLQYILTAIQSLKPQKTEIKKDRKFLKEQTKVNK